MRFVALPVAIWFFCFQCADLLHAQTDSSFHTLGVAANSLTFANAGFTYGVGTTESMWRVWGIASGFGSLQGTGSLISVRKYSSDSTPTTEIGTRNIDAGSMSISVRAGHQWRSAIASQVQLSYEIDAFVGYSRVPQTSSELGGDSTISGGAYTYFSDYTSTQYSLGFTFPIGLHYRITRHLEGGIELLPSIYYLHVVQKNVNNQTSGGFADYSDRSLTYKGYQGTLGLSSPLFSLCYVW